MGDDGIKGWEEDIGKFDKEALDLSQDSHHRRPLRQAQRSWLSLRLI